MAYYVHKDTYLRTLRRYQRALGVSPVTRGAARA
jgi:hypothetical protein